MPLLPQLKKHLPVEPICLLSGTGHAVFRPGQQFNKRPPTQRRTYTCTTRSGTREGDCAVRIEYAKVRADRRAALCVVADALVRQQGYKLAQIVAQIHAPDLAVGDVGGAGVALSGDDDEDFWSIHHHPDDADLLGS